jgi:hypothetical protein
VGSDSTAKQVLVALFVGPVSMVRLPAAAPRVRPINEDWKDSTQFK